MKILWAGEWHSNNLLDGERRHLLYENGLPVLFGTRKACREFIKANYGYVAEREDLRTEPHGWRMPQAVKVKIVKLTKEILV